MKQHIAYFDVLRVVAIFAVLLCHLTAAMFNRVDVFTGTWEVANFLNGFARWGVPVFVMISGALFLDPAREISLRKLYGKNVVHLAVVLLFWSVCYAWAGFINYPPATVRSLVENIILGRVHLWFLYMLMGLYIIVPLLRPICQDKKLIRYFLGVCFIFSFFIPTVIYILTGLTSIWPQGNLATGLEWFTKLLTENIRFHFTLEYVAYFVLGYYMYSVTLSSWQRKLIYVFGLLGCGCWIVFTRFVSQKLASPFDFSTDGNMTLFILFAALAVFVFVKQHIGCLSAKALAYFNHLSTCVLGIYLIHIGVQNELNRYFWRGVAEVSSWSVVLSAFVIFWALLIFCISWFATEIIRKFPWAGKKIM